MVCPNWKSDKADEPKHNQQRVGKKKHLIDGKEREKTGKKKFKQQTNVTFQPVV